MISIVDILVVAHAWSYRRGKHRDVLNITRQLNAARGLRPMRAVDLDEFQRDYDEEREQGWSIS
jgi:hypothetical protein